MGVRGKRLGSLRRLAVVALACAGAAAGLALTAAPAHAYPVWLHNGISSCETCHGVGTPIPPTTPPTNAACTQCHFGFQTIGSLTCWACHAPGQDVSAYQTAAGCSSTCHLFAGGGPDDYTIPVSHGQTPHLGADFAPCTGCHSVSASPFDPDGSPHHDGIVQEPPTCQDCHNGVFAQAQQSHDGNDCTACHGNSMVIPPLSNALCLGCHQNPSTTTGAAQITYTTSLDCWNASCHGITVIHTTSPQMTKTCSDCHTPHYQSLGTCTTCHPDVQGYHHGTAQATPLNDCTACHNGTIAAKKVNHDSIPQCTFCHEGMNIPPQPATCTQCHAASTFGSRECTSCHSKGGIFKAEQVHNANPDTGPCTRCHAGYQKHAGQIACTNCHPNVTTFHHKVASSPGFKKCTACHSRGHAGRRIAASKCAACHKGTRPASKPRAQHSVKIKKLRTCSACHSKRAHASAVSNVTCSNCHGRTFHRRHMPIPTSSICYTCHSSARWHAVGYPCTICHPNLQHNPRPSAGYARL